MFYVLGPFLMGKMAIGNIFYFVGRLKQMEALSFHCVALLGGN